MASSSEPLHSQYWESTTQAVVFAVARERGVDPTALEPLASVVDPDALDALFPRHASTDVRGPDAIEFTYGGYDVVVTRDGRIELSEP